MNELPRTLKLVTVWLLLGTLVFLGAQWWLHERARPRIELDGTRLTLLRGPDGHYHWPGTVQGREVTFLVDTGATTTALPGALARELGLPRGESLRSQTAAGTVPAWRSQARLTLEGGPRLERLPVTVIDRMTGPPLLGMDVLSRLRLVQDGPRLLIEARPEDRP